MTANRPTKSAPLFVGRNGAGSYEIGTDDREWNKDTGFTCDLGAYVTSFCAARWHKATGVRLRVGQVKRIKSLKIVLEK